jgi:hypothetical protein
LGRARGAGPVGKEERGWAGGLKGWGGVKGLGSFLFFFCKLFKSFSNFKLKHFLTFQTLKLFKPYFLKFSNYFKDF